jgi:SAM-dependent methyltransferase
MASNEKAFAQDKKFWNNYLRGRPQAPDALFERIFDYHQSHGGAFNTVHDVGAGNGPYGKRLRSKFNHVIVSDIVAKNVQLAEDRLGNDGFSYRAAKVEDADDIPAGSVDMVFATNVMHFPNQKAAMTAVAKQLRSGGTFACGTFGPARFEDSRLQDLWQRISYQGGRELLNKTDQPQQVLDVIARTQEANVAPLDTEFFLPGAKRVHLNWGDGGIVKLLPPEEAHKHAEPNYTGPDDDSTFEDEEGWSFEADLEGVKEHMNSFPFLAQNPDAFTDLFLELDRLLGDGGSVRGYWPAKIILATRR